MPDVHWGIGATVGSVIPTRGRDHPGGGRRRHRLRHDGGARRRSRRATCRTTCAPMRAAIEAAVPHGRTTTAAATRARGTTPPPAAARRVGARSQPGYDAIVAQAPEGRARRTTDRAPRHARHRQPLHRGLPRRGATASGSCCTPARAASATASAATSSSWRRRTCAGWIVNLPDEDLAYLPRGHRALRRLRRGGGAGRRTSR